MIFAIDPGTTESAYVLYDPRTLEIVENQFGKTANENLIATLQIYREDYDARLVIEQIKSYGNAMGDSTIETCVWIGRFIQAWGDDETIQLVPRKTVVTELCGNPRAKDSNVRQAVIDVFREKYPDPIGKKKAPGPLYGVSADVWSALAIAITANAIKDKQELIGLLN